MRLTQAYTPKTTDHVSSGGRRRPTRSRPPAQFPSTTSAPTREREGGGDVPMSSAPMATPGVASRPDELSEAALLERLALLKPLAAANRGPIRAGDARRVAGEEY